MQSHRTTEESPSDRPLSERVVAAVAAVQGVPEDQVEPTLFEVVDPDGLDRLFANGRGVTRDVGQVCFEMGDYAVRVRAGGGVDVAPVADAVPLD